jgi:hypothetical protein
MADKKATFRIPTAAYEIIQEEGLSRVDASTLSLESRRAITEAAPLPEGVFVVDCTEETSQDIEDWFKQAAAVEAATPKGDQDRFKILNDAVRAIRDGRSKSARENKAR